MSVRGIVGGLSGPAGLLFVLALIAAGGALTLLATDDNVGAKLAGLGLLTLAALLALALLVVRASRSVPGGLPLTSGPAAPWSPILASLVTLTVLFFLKDPASQASRQAAVLIGFGLGVMAWIIAVWSVTFRSRPENVNPRVYADLLGKHRSVLTRLTRLGAAHPDSDAYVEAKKHMDWATGELRIVGSPTQPGVEWASGYAYVNVWMALHRAEEALLMLATRRELAEVVLHDRLRTAGSRLSQLRTKVRAAHTELAKMTNPGVLTAAEGEALTRTEVAAVRQAINEFRDSRRDGLARARNRLNYTTLITAWTAYLVLVVAIGLRAPMLAIAAAAVFFLVGALIGLFAQLGSDAKAEEAVEDFGMAPARLRQTLIGSGLAAVGGVVVTAIVADATAVDRGALPNLANVFTIGANPAQLLVAAVFGLSPHLLIERLTATADQYRADLKQTGTGDAVATTEELTEPEGEP